jgi:hypothetical protein
LGGSPPFIGARGKGASGIWLYLKQIGAGDGIRTRDIDLGKVALYQLSYSRPWGNFILT